MHFFIFIIILATSASAMFYVPKGQAPGVYMAEKVNGTQVHTRISTKPISARFRPRVASRRAAALAARTDPNPDDITCVKDASSSFTPNQNEIQGATNGLADQCDNIDNVVWNHRSWYSISGNVVAFFCNYAGGATQCSTETVHKIVDSLDHHCMGGDITSGGYYTIGHGAFYYGLQHVNSGFCPNSG